MKANDGNHYCCSSGAVSGSVRVNYNSVFINLLLVFVINRL